MGYHFTPVRMATIKKARDDNYQPGYRDKKKHGELMISVWGFFKKLKIELPYDPIVLLLSIYLKEMKSLSLDICTPSFIIALFVIGKTWNQPMCPLTVEWIKIKCDICHKWNLEGIMLSEIS